MPQATRSIEVRGTDYEAVQEGTDWFIYYPGERVYIGKVLFRPHRRDGPYLLHYRKQPLADNLDSLEDAVDILDRERLLRQGN